MPGPRVLLAVAAAAAVLLGACGEAGGAASAADPSPRPSVAATSRPASASASASVSPSPSPPTPRTPVATPAAPGFSCSGVSGGSAAASSHVLSIRVGVHPGYDRLVFEFDGAVPSYAAQPSDKPEFTLLPSGQPVTLAGSAGVLIGLKPVQQPYGGPARLVPAYPYLREVRLLQDSSSIQLWGLGVAGRPCLRVSTDSDPTRLVVDVTGL